MGKAPKYTCGLFHYIGPFLASFLGGNFGYYVIQSMNRGWGGHNPKKLLFLMPLPVKKYPRSFALIQYLH